MIARRAALLALAAGLTLPLTAPATAHGTGEAIEIVEPWARASLAGRNSAAYMTIVNHTAARDELVAASTPVAKVVELHTHLMEGGVMRMRPVRAIEVNAGEPAVLRPGGLHVMLIDLTRDLKPGETIPLTLSFRNSGERTVEVPVVPAGARDATGHGHGRAHGPGHRH
ncbi:copper chaperone PCu(A)C [Elioraea sp. Yellowstone]|jgi:copper(I)-binding protein|uniref:copper chaperone PCu(A)C n=1 Tax=Elioraea sp. Yellowstone TaxID=2592070 RepID=UPI0011531677|nr:copper chaperone PCu(A)C [Elioraea sp. Yellowstone]TQF76871.1 copper chaperone PCu(A)C [Elioraea sp. Yellowstone]